MIQRIQSLFLLFASACAFCLWLLPFGETAKAIPGSEIFADRFFTIEDHIALLILFMAAGGLTLISIFLFKNRKLQITLTRFALILNILGIVLGVVLFMQDSPNFGAAEPSEQFGLGLPVLFIIFGILALRFIHKDEKLVRSMDRLR